PSEKPSSVIMGLHRLLCESIKVPGVAPVLNRLVTKNRFIYNQTSKSIPSLKS
ncbi:MAG: hypothetical protein ACI909_004048, partial [Planctomycetota bacterium]